MSKKQSAPAGQNRAVETILTHQGRFPDEQFGVVNTPVYRASTILHPDVETLLTYDQPYVYGRTGTPTLRSVEDMISALEEGTGTRLTPSGLSAITVALMSVLESGDELLIADNAYEPTRMLASGILAKQGVVTKFFDPRIGGNIASLFTDKTRAIMLESPGSLTFELQDLPAIANARGQRQISIVIDNTWATPLFYQPLKLGADLVVHAGTKMFVGHSDAMLGTVTANADHWEQLKSTHYLMGLCAGPDDCFLAARGLRTLSIRMKEMQARALEMANWLEGQEFVRQVLHPALPSHPDHALFKRDFTGSGCLFSFCLPRAKPEALAAFLDNMELFGLGYSWGGFESLILPVNLAKNRSATRWPNDDQIIRLHIGLEDIDDLKADISAGLTRYRTAM